MPLVKRSAPTWTVVGVDNGIQLAAVVSPGGLMTRARLHARKLTQHAPARRCAEAAEWMRDVVEEAGSAHALPVHVFVESPFINPRTISAAIPLARLQGALMAAALASGATVVYPVEPAQWKSGVLGQGNAKKEEIVDWMETHWPWLFEHATVAAPKAMFQDAIDAGGIMLYGADVLTRASHLTEEITQDAAQTRGRPA